MVMGQYTPGQTHGISPLSTPSPGERAQIAPPWASRLPGWG
jgi:hypothetical protein